MGKIYRGRVELGGSSDYQAETSQAIEYLHKAANLYKAFGDEVDLAASLNNLAYLYSSQGKYDQAEPFYTQALAILVNSLGREHPNTIAAWQNYTTFLKTVVREQSIALENLLSAGSPMTQQLLHQMIRESRSNLTTGFKPRQ